MIPARARLWGSCVAQLLLLAACGATDPSTTTGSLRVTAATTGTNRDADGYTLLLQEIPHTDFAPHGTLAPTGQATIGDLAPSVVSLWLVDLALNCEVSGENPRSATISAGELTEVGFVITCSAPPPGTGSILITTTTTGPVPAYNYFVSLDRQPYGWPIPPNGALEVPGVAAGSHTVFLGDVGGNCTVNGGLIQTTLVPAGGTATVRFLISCATFTSRDHVGTSTAVSPGDLGPALAH